MDKKGAISREFIGTLCIVSDEHNGTYKGIILNGRRSCVAPFSGVVIDVSILECLTPPNNEAQLNPLGKAKRGPYPKGSRQTFASDRVKPLLEELA